MANGLEFLEVAKDGRKACSCCGNNILKGEKFFRDAMTSWRKSHTVNICKKCLGIMAIEMELNLEDYKEEYLKIKKEMLAEKL